MNESMGAVLRGFDAAAGPEILPPELASLARVGVWFSSDGIRLALPHVRSAAPKDLADYSLELWLNTVHLESRLPVSDPGWRAEVATWGVALATCLLDSAAVVTDLPVQATISLQSALVDEDPEIDFAVGALHLYCVRTGADDASTDVNRYRQPVLVLTAP